MTGWFPDKTYGRIRTKTNLNPVGQGIGSGSGYHHLKSAKFVKQTNKSQLRTILLVDDGDDTRILTKWFLNNFGYTVEPVRNATDALERFNPRVHDLVITDNAMPGMTGAELAHVLKLRSPTTPIIMFTGQPPADTACLDLVLQRPAHLMLLKDGVEQLLSSPSLKSESAVHP